MAIILTSNVELSVRQIVIACLLLVALLVVLWIGVWYYRRWWLGQKGDDSTPGWTLEDLRRLRDQGQLGEEEYRILRDGLVGAVGKAQTPRPQSVGQASDWDWVAQDPSPGDRDFDMKNQPPG